MSNGSDFRQQAFQQAGREMYENYLREFREMQAYHEDRRHELEQTIREQALDEERAELLRRALEQDLKRQREGLDRKRDEKLAGRTASRENQKAREKIEEYEERQPSDRDLIDNHIARLEKKHAEKEKDFERRKENLVLRLSDLAVGEKEIENEAQRADKRAQRVLDTKQAEIEKAKKMRDRWEWLSKEEQNRYLQRIDRENERNGWSR